MSAIRKWQLLSLILLLALAASSIALGRLYHHAWLRPAAVVEGHAIPMHVLYARLLERYGRDELAKLATEAYIPAAAARAKISVTDQEVKEKLAALKLRFGSDQEFESFVRYRLRITPDQLRDQLRLTMLGERFMIASTPITEDEIRSYWRQHKAEFRQPERFRVLKMTLPAQREAEQARAEIERGADFSRIAAERSVDPYTRAMRGVIPQPLPLTEFSTDPRYKEIFAGLKPGDVTPPMQANYGVMLVKLVERMPPHEPDLEADRAEARERAIRGKIGDPNVWMLERLKRAKVKNLLWGDDWGAPPPGSGSAGAPPGMGY